MIVAGIGCRAGCTPEAVIALVRTAAARAGGVVDGLAVPAFKHAEPGLPEAARRLGVPLLVVDDAAMAAAQPGCVTVSAVARHHTGFASVAEAAALAAAGPGATLLLARIAEGGVTCALARAAP